MAALHAWTDARIDDLAAALHPLPVKVAELAEATEQLEHATESLRRDLSAESFLLRQELAAAERLLVQISWGLIAALVGAAAALLAALA